MNYYRKKYRGFANKEGTYTHSALYQMVRDLLFIVAKNRKEHPRTRTWKNLEEIVAEIDLAQKDWFEKSLRGR